MLSSVLRFTRGLTSTLAKRRLGVKARADGEKAVQPMDEGRRGEGLSLTEEKIVIGGMRKEEKRGSDNNNIKLD